MGTPEGRTQPGGRRAPGGPLLHLACVQAELQAADYESPAALARRVDGWMRQIRRRVPDGAPLLVAFPEDIGTFAVFFGHGDILRGAGSLGEAIAALIRRRRARVWWRRLTCRVGWVRALALALGDGVARTYAGIFSDAARRWGAYVVAGSAVLPARTGGGPRCAVYNASYVFGPDGRLLLRQPKTHLTDIEGPQALDIVAAPLERLNVVPTPIGTLGVAICLDAFQRPVVEHLVRRGARILVQPSANPKVWSRAQQAEWLESSWRAVQEWSSLAYALNPMLVGQLLGLRFEGQSAIFSADSRWWRPDAGYGGTGPPFRGFVAAASHAAAEALVQATVWIPGSTAGAGRNDDRPQGKKVSASGQGSSGRGALAGGPQG